MSKRGGRIGRGRALVPAIVLLGVSRAAVGAPAAPPPPPPEEELAVYMKALLGLRERWQQAGELVSKRRFDKARALLSQPVPPVLSERWQRANQDFAGHDARWMNTEQVMDWLLSMEACAAAERTLSTWNDPKVAKEFRLPVQIAECYLAAGQPAEARRVNDGAAKTNTSAQFNPFIEELAKTLTALPSDKEPPPASYVGHCRRGWSGGCSTWTLIRAWQLRNASPDGDWALAQLFGQFSRPWLGIDDKGHELALTVVARSSQSDGNRKAEALDTLAHEAHRGGRNDRAQQLWRELMSQHPNTPVWGAATYNLGLLLRRDGRCPDAIPIFGALIASQVDDRDPGSHLMETYRNYRPLAQWNIALCNLSARDYARALAAFRTLRTKYPVQSWCGNEHRAWQYRYDLFEGVSLEYAGRVSEAVVLYARAAGDGRDVDPAGDRLVDLYMTTGQVADLERIAAQSPKGRLVEGVQARLRLAELERTKAWPKLVAELNARAPHRRRIAQILGRHGQDPVPALLGRVDRAEWPDTLVWQALGRSATPQAIAAIADRARREKNIHRLKELVAGLRVAGSAGQTALADLATDAKDNLKIALESKPDDDDQDRDESRNVTFPPAPAKLRLPTSIPAPATGWE